MNVLFNTFKMNIVKRYPSRSRLLRAAQRQVLIDNEQINQEHRAQIVLQRPYCLTASYL